MDRDSGGESGHLLKCLSWPLEHFRQVSRFTSSVPIHPSDGFCFNLKLDSLTGLISMAGPFWSQWEKLNAITFHQNDGFYWKFSLFRSSLYKVSYQSAGRFVCLRVIPAWSFFLSLLSLSKIETKVCIYPYNWLQCIPCYVIIPLQGLIANHVCPLRVEPPKRQLQFSLFLTVSHNFIFKSRYSTNH